MNSITDGLLGQLQGQPMEQLGQQLGLNAAQTQQAVSTALPLLLGALGRNAQDPAGAQSLFGALQRDHAGMDLGSVLGAVLGGGGQGGQILGHVFGPQQDVAAQGLGTATGLRSEQASTLLRWLAPIAMAYLAKRLFDGRRAAAPATPTASTESVATDDASPQVLTRELGDEHARIERDGGAVGGLLGAIFDRNRDGRVDLGDLTGAMPAQRGGGANVQGRLH